MYIHDLGRNLQNFVCISDFLVHPTLNGNYKGRQNSEKIQSVKKIRLNLRANDINQMIRLNLKETISLTITSNLL